jgi:hypothetical protein
MSMIGFAGPVKDVAAMRALSAECNGARKSEYVESRKRVGITKERVFLAETPMGAMILVYSEGVNAGLQMARFHASSHPFDKHYMDMVVKASGVDFSKMPAGPPPHLAFEWTNGKPGKTATMLFAPVPEPAKFWQLCREMTHRFVEHGESRERHGGTLERAFYLHDAKVAAVYIEGDDFPKAVGEMMSSTAAYDKWFVDQITAVHGIDFRAAKAPVPELLTSYDA